MLGIIDLPKIWKKLLLVDWVHLDFIGNASRYIDTHYAYAIAFIVYSIQVFRLMIKFRITKEKEKEEDTIKRLQQNV